MTRAALLAELAARLGQPNVLTGADAEPYLTDWRRAVTGRAIAVLRPADSGEVAQVVRLCAAAGVPVVPHMATGATDAVTLNAAGIPTYGVSGLFRDPDGNGVHGLNERIRIRSVTEGRQFLYGLVKAYADQKD